MAKGITIAGRKVKIRFFFFVGITLALILFIVKLAFKQPSYELIQYGEITSWGEHTGLVIRQEMTYATPEYGKVEFFVSKGQNVEKDSLLAVIYKEDFNQKLIDDLYKVRQKISDYQNKNLVQEIVDKDYDNIQENINQIISTMQYSIYDGEIHDMPQYERQLRGLLKKRKEILSNGELSNSYLETLYEQEKDIEDKLDEWKVEITAPESGIISFELDGLEEILTPNEIDYLNLDQYTAFAEHKSVDSDDEGSVLNTPLFKIVEPDKWYIASIIPDGDIFYEEGDVVSLKLLGLSEDIIDATVYKIDFSEDSNSSLVILEMTEGIESVLEFRDVHIEIGTTTYGFMVARDAIINNNGETGVKIKHNGDIEYVKIKVKAMNDKWAIIEKENEADILELNDSIIVK